MCLPLKIYVKTYKNLQLSFSSRNFLSASCQGCPTSPNDQKMPQIKRPGSVPILKIYPRKLSYIFVLVMHEGWELKNPKTVWRGGLGVSCHLGSFGGFGGFWGPPGPPFGGMGVQLRSIPNVLKQPKLILKKKIGVKKITGPWV